MSAGDRPQRPPTAQEFVLGEVRRAIVSGQLRPGDQIRQDALAERLGTSRVPLREALKILEGEGLVTYHAHRGYFVAKLSSADLVEVYRIRLLLEEAAVAAALPLVTDEECAAMAAALEDIAAAAARSDITAMTEANRHFHFLLFDASGMPRLTRLIRQLWDATDAYRSVYFAEAENRTRVDEEHRRMLAAIRERDITATIDLLRIHRDHAVERVRTILEA